MMKIKLLILFIFISTNSFSQGEASNWFFGNRAAIKFNSDNTITVLSTLPNTISINTDEGCSSYSNANGDLLLYTDGRTVWDRNNTIMPNGDYYNNTGLLGDPSSTQSGIIVPKPDNRNQYYIFTVDEPHHENADFYPNQFQGIYTDSQTTIPGGDDGFNNGLNYSIVDISRIGTNGSIGDVISRNNHLITYNTDPNGEEIKFKCSEKITAVKTRDRQGYWVITHFVDKFYSFKIDANGLNTNPVVTTIAPEVSTDGYRRNSIGQIKVSPNGKKIAIAHSQLGTVRGVTTRNGCVYLYDFDNETGIISNGIAVIENTNPYGIEFSSETKKLYISTGTSVWQYNLVSRENIEIARQISSSSLQLGPDQKIYKANMNNQNSSYLDAINFPELDGTAADYQRAAVNLGSGISRFGLPPFITSIFNSSIKAENFCHGDNTMFEITANGTIDSISWDFGDGITFSNAILPTLQHQYLNPGNYIVRATIVIEGISINAQKNITILELPAVFPATLDQCSATSSVTNIAFDLSKAKNTITNSNLSLETTFYLNIDDAENDTNAQDEIFRNTQNPQILIAKVKNLVSGCSSITTLTLNVISSNSNQYEIRECDDDGNENGFTSFNLNDANIAADFAATANVSYYLNSDDAALEINSINSILLNTTAYLQTVYAKVTDAGECLGIFPLGLFVEKLPNINIVGDGFVCTNLPNKKLTLDAGLLEGNANDFEYMWSTGEETATIKVNQPGIYTVKVSNTYCEKTRTITVSASNNPTIEKVNIIDATQNNTVTVLLSNQSIGSYSYSLDEPNGPFQESNYFENVASGLHTIYVVDENGCGLDTEDIAIIGIPKFFSPNNDGYNDTWNIIGINSLFNATAKIYIFDRFGKLLADIDPKGNGWNGMYNNHHLPATDYWYTVKFDNGRILRGHFSLVR